MKNKECANCGTNVAKNFCPHCGQEWALNLTLGIFCRQFIQRAVGVDSRFGNSLRTLILSPGKMTLDYISGRQQAYTHPIKLYFAISLLFLFCLSKVRGFDILLTKTGVSVTTVKERIFQLHSQTGLAWFDDYFSLETNRADVMGHTGALLLLTIPLSAFLLRLVFQKRPLVQHLVFSFHFHSAALLILMPGLYPWDNKIFHDLFNTALSGVAIVFLGRMLRRVYASSWSQLFLLLPLYFIFYAAIFLCLAFMKIVMINKIFF